MFYKGELLALLSREDGKPVWQHPSLEGDTSTLVQEILRLKGGGVFDVIGYSEIKSSKVSHAGGFEVAYAEPETRLGWQDLLDLDPGRQLLCGMPFSNAEVCIEHCPVNPGVFGIYPLLWHDNRLKNDTHKVHKVDFSSSSDPAGKSSEVVLNSIDDPNKGESTAANTLIPITQKRITDHNCMYVVIRWLAAKPVSQNVAQKIIHEMSERLKNTLRVSDRVERHLSADGHEQIFYVTAPDIEEEFKASKVLEKIRLAFLTPVFLGTEKGDDGEMSISEIPLKFSIAACAKGITDSRCNAAKPMDKLSKCHICACGARRCASEADANPSADIHSSQECYLALREKARCYSYIVFPSDITVDSDSHVLQAELYDTLRNDVNFKLFFQPQVDAITGRIVGVESLLRWSRDNEVFVPPHKILDAAAKAGFMFRLTDWIIEQAFRAAVRLEKAGCPIPISVNLSPQEIRDRKDVVDKIAALRERYKVSPDMIEFELTETSAMPMDEGAGAVTRLNAISEAGHPVAIDDFGAGYSSISYLKVLPATKLKIDMSLVTDIDKNDQNQSLFRSLVQIAKNMGMKVVAEGVETKEELDIVIELGCNYIQGYYTGRPQTLSAIIHEMNDEKNL